MCMSGTDKVRWATRTFGPGGDLIWIEDPNGDHYLVPRETWERVVESLKEIEAFRLRNLETTCPDCDDGCSHGARKDRILIAARRALKEIGGE